MEQKSAYSAQILSARVYIYLYSKTSKNRCPDNVYAYLCSDEKERWKKKNEVCACTFLMFLIDSVGTGI